MQRAFVGAIATIYMVTLSTSVLASGSAAGTGASSSPDRYGGVGVRVAEPTGHFGVKKVGQRWVFVTPEGNAFWLVGMFDAAPVTSIDHLNDSYLNRVRRKYGDLDRWGQHQVERLKSWGFTGTAEYSIRQVLPGSAAPSKDWASSMQMPFMLMIRPSYYSLRNQDHMVPSPVKDIIAGTDPAVYKGWRGNPIPDVFDPNFKLYADGLAKALKGGDSPWLLGVATDDSDNIVGFGPGPEVKGLRVHPHIAWIVLATDPQQTTNEKFKATYSDARVYTKLALRDFLQAKYGSIAKLNQSWGASYSTFESEGGWGKGTGLLDENGSHPWVGQDWNALASAHPQVRADLDEFLYRFAKQYFSVTAGAIRKYFPHTLVFGPATLNGWAGMTRSPVLKAAGESVDVIQASLATPEIAKLTTRAVGDVPIVSWTGLYANEDSFLWRFPAPSEGYYGEADQPARGRLYARYLQNDFDAVADSGVHPVIGTKYWALVDSWGEKRNWGFVSLLDNAYDGKEAVRAAGKDGPFSTGGEERDFGDFISPVRAENLKIMEQLRTSLLAGVAHEAAGKTNSK